MARELYKGIVIPAGIVPNSIDAEYPTHYSEYGKGGWHEVETIADRNALTDAQKSVGMAVFVNATKELFTLNADGTWTLFSSGGGGGGGDLSNYYTKSETNNLLEAKADESDLLNLQDEVDSKLNTATFEDYVTTTDQEILSVKNDLTDLSDGIGTLVDGEYIDASKSIGENLSFLDTQIKDNADNIEGLASSVTDLEVSVGDLGVSINDIQDDISGINSSVDDLQSDVADLASKISGVFHWKGNVPNREALNNIVDPEVGDVYNLLDTGANYAWTGTEWDKLSETFSFDAYTKAETDALLANKTDYKIENARGRSLIFNEADGGGSQYLNKETNIQSFTGVNDGSGGIYGQLYAINKDTKQGSRINITADGIFYTVSNSIQHSASDEIATLGDIENELENAVMWQEDKSDPNNPDREFIQLENHDYIAGKDTNGNLRLLAMLSKYDVADFGNPHTHTNINTQRIVTINDNQAVLTDQLLGQVLLGGEGVTITPVQVTDPTTGFVYTIYTIDVALVDAYTKAETDNLLADKVDFNELTSAIVDAISEHNEDSNAHADLISQIELKWADI